MKTTTGKVVNIYPLLDKAKYARMNGADRKVLTKAMFAMKKVTTDFNGLRDEAIKRLRPEGFDRMEELLGRFNSLGQDERKEIIADPGSEYHEAFKANAGYGNAVNDCIREELDKEVVLDFTPLTGETLDRLLDSNTDWTLGQAMDVEELLCARED